MNNYDAKYNTISISMNAAIGKIDGKTIEKVKNGTRTSDSISLLNNFIKDEALLPDIFISEKMVTTSKHIFNLILLNFLGEVNNIFLDTKTGLFKAVNKELPFPENTISLNKTLISKNWFLVKSEMIKNGASELEAQSTLDYSVGAINKILDAKIIVRENINMKTESFFKLSTK